MNGFFFFFGRNISKVNCRILSPKKTNLDVIACVKQYYLPNESYDMCDDAPYYGVIIYDKYTLTI